MGMTVEHCLFKKFNIKIAGHRTEQKDVDLKNIKKLLTGLFLIEKIFLYMEEQKVLIKYFTN